MSHQDFAALWSTLQGRSDIDNIVHELTGRYCLQISQYTTDRALLRAKTFEHIVALRTIFDFQRTILQASILSTESRSSLLSPTTLLSSLSHLFELKLSVFRGDDSLPDHDAHCSFIAQTQLSGLRALLLHDCHISQSEYKDLLRCFRQAWKSESLSVVDHFAVNLLGFRLLAELSNQTRGPQYSKAACGSVDLPDFYQHLFPAREGENVVLSNTRNVIISNRESADWFERALIIYDTFWSTIAAMIHLCMNSQTKKQSGQWSFSEEAVQLNDLHTILISRFKMLDELYVPSPSSQSREGGDRPDEQLKTMLCMEIQPTCYLHECTCLSDKLPRVQESVGLTTRKCAIADGVTKWLQLGGRETISTIRLHIQQLRGLETKAILHELFLSWEIRNGTSPDLGKELRFVSQKLVEYVQGWCAASVDLKDSGSNICAIPDDVFIINCPELHAIPGQSIFPNPRNWPSGPSKSGDIRLPKDSPSHIRCTQCSWTSNTAVLRKVEPLVKLSEYIQERLELQHKLLKARIDHLARSTSNIPSDAHPAAQTKKSLPTPAGNRAHEQRTIYRAPKMPNLRPIEEGQLVIRDGSEQASPPTRYLYRVADSSGLLVPSPSLRYSSSTIASSTSSPSFHSGKMSHSSSRTLSPPLMPSQPEYSDLPEVVSSTDMIQPKRMAAMSIRSNESPRSQERKSMWGIFKSSRTASALSSTPAAKFFTSGKTLLLWNELGAACYEVENMAATPFRVITTGDVLLVAGGTKTCAVLTKAGSVLFLRVFQGTDHRPILEMELEQVPFRMSVSADDHFTALKFGNLVHILNLSTGTVVQHRLPAQNGRCGPNDHLVAFSTDSKSFIASTRFEPERVITYSCACENPLNGVSVESSAPYGLVGDDGLSSIVGSGTVAFLATFTEKGYPVYLHLSASRLSSRSLRDNNQQIGSRIHSAVTCPTGQNLVMINDRNEVFWIATPFDKEQSPVRVGNVKRTRSVKREVELGMSSGDQVHVFWIEKGKGVLVTLGRNGGKSRPVELNVTMEQLLETCG